jgi:hypothetical protein
MSDFVVIFGPSAVGKMTVGMKLAERLGYRLFHNHASIEMVRTVFPDGPVFRKLVLEFRQRMISEAGNSGLQGLIFTYIWGIDLACDKAEIDSYAAHFDRAFYVELQASQSVRLQRNRTPLRLQEKPSKRDTEWSQDDLLKRDIEFRQNTLEGDFFYPDRHLKIENDLLGPDQVADQIATWIRSFQ